MNLKMPKSGPYDTRSMSNHRDMRILSVTVDGGGASSGSILYTAVQYLEEGKCDYAVVGATNLIFKPGVQIG